jgi:sugar transferase EpsL
MKQSGWRLLIKRVADATLAAGALAVTAPVLVVGALGVLVSMGRPMFFVQTRPGRQGRPFRVFKLRTMSTATDATGRLLADAARLTRWGRWMRALSIDEIPQLLNVLSGDMSLVGPRPLLMQYLGRYTPEQARRHQVLPGITGWAQVHGRNALGWDQRFALDVWYVDNWSLKLDAEILLRTIVAVIMREGISGAGSATMEEFMRPGTE